MIFRSAPSDFSICGKRFFNLRQTIFHLAQIDFIPTFCLTNAPSMVGLAIISIILGYGSIVAIV
mgnify:CR=1 FL=1